MLVSDFACTTLFQHHFTSFILVPTHNHHTCAPASTAPPLLHLYPVHHHKPDVRPGHNWWHKAETLTATVTTRLIQVVALFIWVN